MSQIKRKFVFAHMEAAWAYSKLSHCTRLKVGAVLVKKNNPIAIGYNGRPSGEPNVGELPDGTTHPDVIHAEANAYKKLIRSNESAEKSILFVTHSCCKKCAIEAVDAGSKVVFYDQDYRSRDGLRYLLDHGVKVYQVNSEDKTIYEVGIDSENNFMKLFRFDAVLGIV